MIQFILHNILVSDVYQFQTLLRPHSLMQISLFTITYKVNPSGNVYCVFVVLTIIESKHRWFGIKNN